MRATRLFLILLAAISLSTTSRAVERPDPDGPVPEPRFDRIDYSKPRDYLALDNSLGNPDRIRKLAATLKSSTPERSLLAIGKWIDANLTCDNKAAYAWRDFDRIVDSKVYGGCADHALVFGALARACGIPTVWVKTMDADWIREFRNTGTCTSWRGHVFLEVHLDGRWRLLDASGLRLYDDYDPALRILPGNRYAYDKGGDPKALILSVDWERWKRQTAAYFAEFDLTKLPVGEGRSLGAVYVAANSPVWQALSRRVGALGYPCQSFNHGFERFLPEARGKELIITCVGDQPVLPQQYHDRYLPLSLDALRAKLAHEPKGVMKATLEDGTRLTLVYGRDVDAILEAIETLELAQER